MSFFSLGFKRVKLHFFGYPFGMLGDPLFLWGDRIKDVTLYPKDYDTETYYYGFMPIIFISVK